MHLHAPPWTGPWAATDQKVAGRVLPSAQTEVLPGGATTTASCRGRSQHLTGPDAIVDDARSDPALAPEVPDLDRRGDDDETPHEAVALRPGELGDVLEVLPVEPNDERRQQQDR